MQVVDFPSHCGSKVLHQLYDLKDDTAHWPDCLKQINLEKKIPSQFYRTLFAIYVNYPKQRKVYEALKKQFKILYQSEVLVNPSTKNEYFIVIYLNEKP